MTKPARHECAFCGRPEKDCARIIMGAVANICDECVGLCVDICAETGDGQPVPRPSVLTARAEAAEARYAALVAALPECTECDAKATHGHYDAAMFACDEHARDGTRWYEMGHAAIVRADAVRA